MKKKARLTLWIMIIAGMYCSCSALMAKPQVTMYTTPYPSKSQHSHIDVYRTQAPSRGYIEIAEISCRDTSDSWNIEQIIKKAKEIGADGVIIMGRTGSYAVGVPVGDMTYAASRTYGLTAIAIKYQ